MEPQDVGLLVEAGVADPQRLLNMTGLMAVFDAIERHAEAVSDLSNAVELVSHGLLLRLLRADGIYERSLIFSSPPEKKICGWAKLAGPHWIRVGSGPAITGTPTPFPQTLSNAVRDRVWRVNGQDG